MKFKIINLNKKWNNHILFKQLICKMKVNTSQINMKFTKKFCIYVYTVLQKQQKNIFFF